MKTNVEQGSRSGSDRGSNRALRWSAWAVALAVTPKCLLCVLGYLALAAGAQVEICGVGPSTFTVSRCIAPLLSVVTLGAAAEKPGLNPATVQPPSGR